MYYARPYASYERGANEKQHSLVRRFFPKGTFFDNITDEQVAFVENWINNLPRKIFNYHSADLILILSYLILQFRNYFLQGHNAKWKGFRFSSGL